MSDKQTYAGNPNAHRVVVPVAFRQFVSEMAVLQALHAPYLTADNVDQAMRLMRAACNLEADPTNQRHLFREMLLLLPAELRVYVIAAIKRKVQP